ncbi:MAG: HNH endonuclease [Ktedonobacterales bacterium]
MYYVPSSVHREQGVGRLHQEIWKDAHGEIPPGHEIHHRDGNPLNNLLDNLDSVSAEEHREYHTSLYTPEERAKRREWFHRIRPKASNWHRSADGREWHSVLGKLFWEGRKERLLLCDYCGREYQSRAASKHSKFCSNKCRSAFRRASGRDNTIITCAECGAEFERNRYAKALFCSRSCATRAQHRSARAGL